MSISSNSMNASSVNGAILQLQARALVTEGALRENKAAALALLKHQHQQQLDGVAGHAPSGPRRKNEGVEDEDQGIVSAEPTQNGGARLRVTLLAAGFVIGPSGSSVREISRTTGAELRSWSETWADPATPGARARKVRTIVIEGKRLSVVGALEIISAAVDRYNELCGGKYCGQAVDRSQSICGVHFFYSPPPKAAVPFAAALRSQDRSGSPRSFKSPSVPRPSSPAFDKENLYPSDLQQIGQYAQQYQLPSTPLLPAVKADQLLAALRTASPAVLLAAAAAAAAATPGVASSSSPGLGDGSFCNSGLTLTAGRRASLISEPGSALCDPEEAVTPAYNTYALFGEHGLQRAEATAAGPSASRSLFSSAFEPLHTPTAFGDASGFSAQAAPAGSLPLQGTALYSGTMCEAIWGAQSAAEEAVLQPGMGLPSSPSLAPTPNCSPFATPAQPPNMGQQLAGRQPFMHSVGNVGQLPSSLPTPSCGWWQQPGVWQTDADHSMHNAFGRN